MNRAGPKKFVEKRPALFLGGKTADELTGIFARRTINAGFWSRERLEHIRCRDQATGGGALLIWVSFTRTGQF